MGPEYLSITKPDLVNNPSDPALLKQYDEEGDLYDGTATGFASNASAKLIVYESDKKTPIHKNLTSEGTLVQGLSFCEQGLNGTNYYVTGNGEVNSKTSSGAPSLSNGILPVLPFHKIIVSGQVPDDQISKISGVFRINNPKYYHILKLSQKVDGDELLSFPVNGTTIAPHNSGNAQIILGLNICNLAEPSSSASELEDWNVQHGYTQWTSDNTNVATVDSKGVITLTGEPGVLSIHGNSIYGLPEVVYKRTLNLGFKSTPYTGYDNIKNCGNLGSGYYALDNDSGENWNIINLGYTDWGSYAAYGWFEPSIWASTADGHSYFRALWYTYTGENQGGWDINITYGINGDPAICLKNYN